jgi:hypothetical protein
MDSRGVLIYIIFIENHTEVRPREASEAEEPFLPVRATGWLGGYAEVPGKNFGAGLMKAGGEEKGDAKKRFDFSAGAGVGTVFGFGCPGPDSTLGSAPGQAGAD